MRWIEEDAEAEGLGRGLAEVWLEVKVTNEAAKRFYGATGFEEVQETEGDVEEIWLRKRIGVALNGR